MQLRGVEFKGTVVVVGGESWDLATFELRFHKRDRQAKELTLAFRRLEVKEPPAPAMEVDVVFWGVRCARLVERDAGGLLEVERFEFLRDVDAAAPDPTDPARSLLAGAKGLVDGARLEGTAVGEGCHVRCADGALDCVVFADGVRCDARRAKSGALPQCDHSRNARVFCKGGALRTVLPSGAVVKGALLTGCGDPEGLGCRVCLRCGDAKVLEDVAPFDLRELNGAVARAEADAKSRKTCARCERPAAGDVICATCGSVCDLCAWQSCRGENDHAVENFSVAQFRLAATRSPRRRSSTNSNGDKTAPVARSKTPPPSASPPATNTRNLRRATTGFDSPNAPQINREGPKKTCQLCAKPESFGDIVCATCANVCDECADTCKNAKGHDVANFAMAQFRLAAKRSPGRRRSNDAIGLSRMKSTLGGKPRGSFGDKPTPAHPGPSSPSAAPRVFAPADD